MNKKTFKSELHSQDIFCHITGTLRDATVLVLWLHHLYGVIFQVEVDLTPPDSVRLIPGVWHSLLKVSFKTQNLGVGVESWHAKRQSVK